MNREEVRELEDACEIALQAAIAEFVPNASQHTVHMMAKAAIAVLEATEASTSGGRKK